LGFTTLKRLAALGCESDHIRAAGTASVPVALDFRVLRATLALVGKGLYEQGQSHFLDQAVLRTFMAKVGPLEQQLLTCVTGDTEAAKPEVAAQLRNVRSKMLPSALSYADDEREVHRLGHLVEELKLTTPAGREDDEGESGEDREESVGPVILSLRRT
jgi:hypothetical protein